MPLRRHKQREGDVPELEPFTDSENEQSENSDVPRLESYSDDSENDEESDEDVPPCQCSCHCHNRNHEDDDEDNIQLSEAELRFFQHLHDHMRNNQPSPGEVPFTFEEFSQFLHHSRFFGHVYDDDSDDDDDDDDDEDDECDSDHDIPEFYRHYPIFAPRGFYGDDDSDDSDEDEDDEYEGDEEEDEESENPNSEHTVPPPHVRAPPQQPAELPTEENENEELECSSCFQYFPSSTFSLNQRRKLTDRRCPDCVQIEQTEFSNYNLQVEDRLILRCSSCDRNLPCGDYSFSQWRKNESRRCKDCVDNRVPFENLRILRELMQIPNIFGLFSGSDDEDEDSSDGEEFFFPRPFQQCAQCNEIVPFWDISSAGLCGDCSKPRVTYPVPDDRSDNELDFTGISEICIVCTDRCASTVIKPCNHRVYCVDHARDHYKHNLDLCPLCREKISAIQLNPCSIKI